MQKLLTMLVLALDFMPGYKTKVGALTLAAAAAGAAYNTFVAPQFGLPVVDQALIDGARVTGETVLGVGVAAAMNRKAA